MGSLFVDEIRNIYYKQQEKMIFLNSSMNFYKTQTIFIAVRVREAVGYDHMLEYTMKMKKWLMWFFEKTGSPVWLFRIEVVILRDQEKNIYEYR